jgi:hypothetical protein
MTPRLQQVSGGIKSRLFGFALAVGAMLTLYAVESCTDLGTTPILAPGGQLSVGDTSAAEGVPATFDVTLASPVDSVVRFHWALNFQSASAADVSGATSGNDSILSGSTSTAILIPTASDGLAEASEVFLLVLSSPTNATINRGTAQAIIRANEGGVDVGWSATLAPVFQTYCVTCHGGAGGTNGGFNISTVQTATSSGDHRPDITPGDGASSNLVKKLSSTPPFGDRMPQGGPYIVADTIALIRQWIDQGAQDN